MLGPILKSLRHAYMDVTMRNGRDRVVRILERPGRWMSQQDLQTLTSDLRQIASKTLDEGDLTYGVFSGDRDRLRDTIVTLVTLKDGTPIAFNALAIMTVDVQPEPVDVLHLGLVMVDPDQRSGGLSWVLYGLTCFLLFTRNQFRPLWISNVTQVPAVVGMVSEMFSDIWPKPEADRRTLNHVLMARRIMANHRHVFGVGADAKFDEDRFVITNAYTGGSDDLKKTWEDAPKHRDAQFNEFCEVELDYARGDDVLQLGKMDLPAIRRYLTREVPRTAVLSVIGAGLYVALRRLILPVLYWSDSTRPFSILRPAKGDK
ncbi:hypothetical protein Q4555_02310 [Octadecabacter sp. 1_MG-2023]|uniref:hypothetical protein n=1 Tax=unclassified Octadecabacter TaxID=196158 RepID=UPI001C08A88E|nr:MULTISPECIES: hypothetical protein [unclassified Octadecabacter]MBU2993065.1 hypothetical protein [Octadecabacter sp. B2R22]MDO6733483.1 hypothetical protein [Octadecabacter sp. 1_MG-2023]